MASFVRLAADALRIDSLPTGTVAGPAWTLGILVTRGSAIVGYIGTKAAGSLLLGFAMRMLWPISEPKDGDLKYVKFSML